jgi:hypothetical protein
MALAKDVMGGGFSAGQAAALGGGYTAITATGSTQGDAATLTASNCVVAGADGTKGVVLNGNVGDSVLVFNNSGSTLKVYPNSGAAISVGGTGLGSANAAFSQLTYKPVWYVKVSATQWISDVGA